MSYQEDDQTFKENTQRDIDKLHKDANICRRVQATLETPGWKEIIGPTLDRMIVDVLGGKVGNMWYYGSLQKADDTDHMQYLAGYKQGLIKYHNQVYNHLRVLEAKRKEIVRLEKAKSAGYQVPMLEEQ